MSTAFRLRDYQLADADAVRAAWARGLARVAIVHATGLGKTSVIAVLATEEAARGGHVWIMAHRGFLLTQVSDRCRAYAPDIEVGRVQAQDREHHAPIIVATVQTMARLVADNDPRLRRPTLVIVDEAHHAAAVTYERIMRWAGCYEGQEIDDADGLPVLVEPIRALGVTATMNREEKAGLGLGDVWQEVVAERGIVWGIDNGPDPADPWHTLPVGQGEGCAPRGWLAPLIGRAVVADRLDLSTVKISRTTHDYADKDLGDMVAQDAPDVVKAWWTEARLPDGSHRQTAIFVPTLDAAAAYLQAFADAGIATSMVDGKTPAAIRGDVYERTGIFGELATGKITALVSVGVLTEGFDCPPVSCIVMARPTKLDHLYQQCVGRGTRPCDEHEWPRLDGTLFYPKNNCLVLDVVGLTATASLRTLVNLVPGASYRGRPCVACGQPRPCGCIASDPGDDGSEDYDAAPRGDRRRRLTGVQDYRTVDLLADAREAGLNWLMTIPEDGYEGIPFLKIGERGGPEYYAILWHNDDRTWSAGWVTAKGAHDGEWVIENATRRDAQRLVESLEIDTGDPYQPRATFAELAQLRDAPWRMARKRATLGQQSFARDLGIVDPEGLTSGACSDEIERVLATRRLVESF